MHKDDVVEADDDVLDGGFDGGLPAIAEYILHKGGTTVHADVIVRRRKSDDIELAGTHGLGVDGTITVARGGNRPPHNARGLVARRSMTLIEC